MLKSTGKCVLMSTMLSALISLLMDNRESIYVVEMTPAEGIEVGKTINISITCLLVLKNLLDFKLQQNGNTVVHIQYSRIIHGYRKLNTSNGFDCDLPVANIDYITCWKHKPTCNDVAAYSCKTFNAVSKKKVFKAKSTLESLQIVKGVKVKGRQVRTFRCVANVGAPFKSHVSFVWIVTKHGKTYNVTKNETMPNTSSCYSRVSSDYTFTPQAKDVSGTSITCKTNFGLLTRRISAKRRVLFA
ncbi:uncharacterized protein LOC128250269 isoform X1 [Octopus bimaculoides]|uniref:uncharacterized protein LOC128250269 isoform X1 n=1 Tax=Octopus bimaculoides TaxID=37653 RepID=UPI0022E690E8|nr:uncharacterized protein LOC128250269 isoform X1 [Octopus bimaculoides]